MVHCSKETFTLKSYLSPDIVCISETCITNVQRNWHDIQQVFDKANFINRYVVTWHVTGAECISNTETLDKYVQPMIKTADHHRQFFFFKQTPEYMPSSCSTHDPIDRSLSQIKKK